MARSYAELQYGATLQACFCHRSFCAADASTPVRRELLKDSTNKKSQSKIATEMWRKRNYRRVGTLILGIDLLREHVAAERNTPIECHGRKISALASFDFRPGH